MNAPSLSIAAAPRDLAIPFHLRMANVDGAIAHLRRRGILVDVVDRAALIRRYRVTGKRDPRLAEEVIELACESGFEVIR
ncbi:MAG: hypothetical protein CL949_12620 [Erythrobacter sp.]|nr:hypothetical protein [Erythrobacter sp.]|tara:strand:- start:349 stop:588 length:240 start_codon:yes stop_codon:yes gene_type:complete